MVRAADDEPVLVGGEYSSTSQTRIQNTTNSAPVLVGESDTGIGVFGTSFSSIGVAGNSNSSSGVQGNSQSNSGVAGSSQTNDGVRGVSHSDGAPGVRGLNRGGSAGVFGYSGDEPFPFVAANTGVHGLASGDSSHRGVLGETDAGQGVRGQATTGIGVFATSESGYAIRGSGRLRFEKVSGVATIQDGSTSKVVDPGVNVTADSFVLLTPKTNIGSRALWFTTNASANTFTIRMSSSRGTNTRVAWLLIG